jgi:hypothetical protein
LAFLAVPAMAADNQKSAPAESQKRICKKVEVTGSLVKHTKVCATREQWTRSAENHEKNARDMVENGTTKPGGN